NSPTMCQMFVHWALEPIRAKFPQTIIYHYMDDILFSQPEPFQEDALVYIAGQLVAKGLIIAPEKIQKQALWKYLGWTLTTASICLHKLELATEIKTLHDAQKLLGDLQWVRSTVGIRNDELAPLMNLLKGIHPRTPVVSSADQKECLTALGQKLISAVTDRRLPDVPLGLLICSHAYAPFTNSKEPLAILEWVFTPRTPPMSIWQRTEAVAYLIKRARTRILDISGAEPEHISLPIKTENFEWMLRHSKPIQLALLSYPGTVHNRQPKDPHLQIILKQRWIQQPKVVQQPLEGLTVFTDAGKRQKKAACTWQEGSSWKSHTMDGDMHDSLQTLELTSVAWALTPWHDQELNIVSDSLYVVGGVQRIEDALIKPSSNQRLCQLFLQVKRAIADREKPCCIIHIRSHQ
ncbi:POK11 protein, partial [Galbula dea]|nr:POK11 protein [Galbula dea]